MHGAKESRDLLMKLSNAHSRVGRRASQNKTVARCTIQKGKHCTRCSKTSQPLWNEVSIAVQPECLTRVDPRTSTRRLERVKTNIDMADCRSPIVSARSQPLWHNVAIRSVFIIITKKFTHLLFLLPLTILRRRNELELNTNCN
jgi:hypothetical protein